MADLVNAYRKDTGEKVRVPARWFDHPRLGEPFAKTPRQRAAERKAGKETRAARADKEGNDDA
jgi:hypothetical protein